MAVLITTLNADNIPEFDGAYIKTNNGNYEEIDTNKKIGVLMCGHGSKYSKFSPASSNVNFKRVSSSAFKGIFVVGPSEHMSYFSIHEAIPRGKNVCVNQFTDYKVRAKTLGNNTKLFVPSSTLLPGLYVAWIERNYWYFEIE